MKHDAKFWSCNCGMCRDEQHQVRAALMVVLWDLDRLFLLARSTRKPACGAP